MYNPFPPYELKYLPMFKQKGVKCFVKQTFDRGRNLLDDPPKPAFLLTHYNDIGLAKEHLDAIRNDTRRRLLIIDEPEDLKELQRIGQKDSGERIYLRFKSADAEHRARKMLDKKLHAYIDHKLGWRVAGYDTIQFSLDFHFGDIYVVLKHGAKYQKVNIDEIETSKGYVL